MTVSVSLIIWMKLSAFRKTRFSTEGFEDFGAVTGETMAGPGPKVHPSFYELQILTNNFTDSYDNIIILSTLHYSF